jgi:hypothetical protein
LWGVIAICVKIHENWQLSRPAPKKGEWFLK